MSSAAMGKPGSIEIPVGLKDILDKHQVSPALIERMTPTEWQEFESRCSSDVPFGLLLQVRHALQDRLEQAEQELAASTDIKRDKGLIKKVQKLVGKLFHGDEGIGTLIYVGEATGLCAFHCVHDKESHTILESSLFVDGYGLEFMAAYPDVDIALYTLIDGDGARRKGPYMDLEHDSFMFVGNEIALLSFPSFDSQSRDQEDEDPMLIWGSICRLQVDKNSTLAVGQYSNFPNTSGGAVVSQRGKLLGVHVETLYHEDHSHFRPPTSPQPPKGVIHPPLPPDGKPIDQLKEKQLTIVGIPNDGAKTYAKQKGQSSEKDAVEDYELVMGDDKENICTGNSQTTKENMLQYVVSNIRHKSSLGAFLPIYQVRQILKNEGVLVAAKQRSSTRKKFRVA